MSSPLAPARESEAPEISVVVPMYNEADNVVPLVAEIRAALDARMGYEIVIVDDGSGDGTSAKVREIAAGFPGLRGVRHRRCCGQSAAVATGVRMARAPVIATLDGDGQNDPADIPKLYSVFDESADSSHLLVAGYRTRRKDTALKRLSSKIANGVRSRLLKDDTPDTGCGLKVFSREAFLDLPRFDHMHRFLPALMLRRGGRVVSVAVNHRPRQRGVSKYGLFDRLWVGITDMLGVMWLQRRGSLPDIETPGVP